MKKFTVSFLTMVLALTAGINISAQEGESTSVIPQEYRTLEVKLEKSNKNIEHEKRKTKAKTWLKRANLMMDIFEVHSKYLQPGITTIQAQIYMGDPNEKKAEIKNGQQVEIWIYDRVELTFAGEELLSFKETDKIYEDPLPEAKRSLEKANELREDKFLFGVDEEDIKEGYGRLKNQYQIAGINNIRDEDFSNALDNLKEYINIDQSEYFKKATVDTPIYYFAAYSAFYDSVFNDAIEYGEVARENNYDEPFNYYILTKSYFAEGDSAQGLEVLKEGFDKYSGNQHLVNELINYYLIREESEKALEYIDVAKQGDAQNPSYAFAEGTLHDELGNVDKAVKAYKEAIEIDPEFYNAYFNLSVLYYNEAVTIFNEAASERDDAKYEKLRDKGIDMIKKAIEPMKKAHEVDPGDTAAIENLKTYYYRLRGEDEKYMKEYEKYNKMLQQR